ncbi:MAG: calcium/proton exchanger [Planctomycetota bacterium]
MKLGPLTLSPLDVLLVALPVAVVLEFTHAPAAWIFAMSAVAIIPLAGWLGRATEHLAARFGPGVGGLLNATFGNAAELIIAIMALRQGLFEVVKASITGSIIGNILLVLGLSLLLGGLKHRRQRFNRTAAGMGATLLGLSGIALVVPAIYHWLAGASGDEPVRALSLDIAIVLFVTYILSLLFQLWTHQHLFAAGAHTPSQEAEEATGEHWSIRRSIIVLLVSTALIAFMSELLVGSVEHTAAAWGMTEVFVGVILVAIVGNAAEHSSAVLMAMKNKMDLAINIAVGSGIQIALFVAPVLVFLSYAIAPEPMNLEFTPMEVIALAMSVSIVNLVAHDGESHWMEGVMLLAVYVILGMAFYFLP